MKFFSISRFWPYKTDSSVTAITSIKRNQLSAYFSAFLFKPFRIVAVLTLALSFAACGGGGGASTYTVGGAVSGLSGTLVLQNNGGDNLTITQNGSSTFATPYLLLLNKEILTMWSDLNIVISRL